MEDKIKNIIKESMDTKSKLLSSELLNIKKATAAVEKCMISKGKLLVFGNGGSAADSQHIAAEFVGRFKIDRAPMAALALTTNTSTITALANDYGYEAVFAKQITALGSKNDIALAISTSGNSKNVIEGVNAAKEKGIQTIALTGKSGGLLKTLCDISITVDSGNTARIQEAHILIAHIMAEIIEADIAGA
ncbi:MAG: SIS domain-containing protein [Candidatus Omnitrophica bacterium]|nr:SIS domain-containing protein [Candidatus Omnitrophota bacterium]